MKVLDDSDEIQALHALWMGLCLKVEAHALTENRANNIFENARESLLYFINEAHRKGRLKQNEEGVL